MPGPVVRERQATMVLSWNDYQGVERVRCCKVKMMRLTLSAVNGGSRGVDVQAFCPTCAIDVGEQPRAQRILGLVLYAVAAATSVTADDPAVSVCRVLIAGAAAVAVVLLCGVGALSLPAFRQGTRIAAVSQVLVRIPNAKLTQAKQGKRANT